MNRRLGFMIGLLVIFFSAGTMYLCHCTRQMVHRVVSDEQQQLNSTAAQTDLPSAAPTAEEPTVITAGY
jgi:hypothetical protein